MCKFSSNGFNVFFHLFLPLLSSSFSVRLFVQFPTSISISMQWHYEPKKPSSLIVCPKLFLTKLVWCVCRSIVWHEMKREKYVWKQSVTLLFSIFVDSSNVVVVVVTAIYSLQTSHINCFFMDLLQLATSLLYQYILIFVDEYTYKNMISTCHMSYYFT